MDSPHQQGGLKAGANASSNPKKQRVSVASNIHRNTDAFRSSNKLAVIGDVTPEEKKNDETVSYRYDVLILLFFVGLITGVLNGCVLWTIKMLSIAQSRLITSNSAGPFLFVLTTAALAATSAFIIKKGKLPAARGSGIPEAKSLMVNDLKAAEYPKFVSLKIMVFRLTSLLLGAGSGLSIGVQGPLVHAAVCMAYCLATYVPDFQSFLDNPSIMKQIFASSAAVGLATVFNAPVGGLLFSVEVTSTYYLISNYWRSFMAATTGAVMYSIFLIDRKQGPRIFEVDYVKDTYHEWELPLYIILGVVTGALTFGFSFLYQRYFVLMRPWHKKHPVLCAALVGAFTAALAYAIHAHSNDGVSVPILVHDCFQNCDVSTMAQDKNVSRIGGLFASLAVHVVTVVMSVALPISAGPFMPMMLLGSLVGRIYGQIVADWSHPGADIYVAGYAMVGAAAFVSGTTHTISTAVIVIEMTGQINMLLPCLIGAVIACGMNKAYKLSLYDQGMVNKGLESFELLLLTGEGFMQVLDENALSVTHTCQVADLFLMLENGTQEYFPVVDDLSTGKLIGSINRRDVFLFIKAMFEKENLSSYIRSTLPEDTKTDDAILQKKFLKVVDSKTTQARFRMIAEAGKRLQSVSIKGMMEMAQMIGGDKPAPPPGSPTGVLAEARKYAAQSGGSTGTGAGAGGSSGGGAQSRTPSTSSRVSADVDRDVEQGGAADPASVLAAAALRSHTHHTSDNHSISSTTSSSTQGLNPLNDSVSSRVEALSLTPAAAQLVESLLEREVDLAKEAAIPVNIFPFTVQEHTTMDQLYVLFEMVKVECVFVVKDDGRLRGMINKDLLLQNLRRKVQ
jgi:H+/Cl- antiporter ClcA/CBS domain-containing protein